MSTAPIEKVLMKKSLLSLLVVFGGVLTAAPVNVTFVDAGNPLVHYNGEPAGPYTVNVNGVSTPAICMDDFLYVGFGDTWTANTTAVNSSNFSQTYLGSGDLGNTSRTILGQTYNTSQVYTAEAYLFSQLTQPKADRGPIQYAAWAIMDPQMLSSILQSQDTAVETYVRMALDNLSFNTGGFTILSQTGYYNGYTYKQEFMVASTPEPASVVLLGTGLLIAGISRFLRRRNAGGAA